MRKINGTLLSGLLLALTLALALLSALPAASAPDPAAPPAWQAKVDPAVLVEASGGGESEFLLFLAEQAELAPASRLPTRAEKGRFVYETLARTARQRQAPLIRLLDAAGASYRPYWIANMIWVRGDEALVRRLAERADVAHLYANPRVRLAEPAERGPDLRIPAGIEWGVNKINAPAVWAAGITGQGIVIGGQDTGYHWSHPALKEQYRGWDGQAVDHNYSWHDAIHPDSDTGGTSSCGVDLSAPCDDYGHGTHTMGTMVGDDGEGNQIGVAPGARWIGCRNMEGGWGTPATYSECFQWFVAPTDLAGQNPDSSRAPDVINNSWSCPPSEGCTDPAVLQTVVENVRAAGIVVVVSAGNSGPTCGSVNTPASIYDASFSVGATSSSDTIASFSGRGPVTVDGSNRLKPDISAPGVNVRSSIPPSGYTTMSGTSMAGPHVAGEVALLLAAEPALAGNVSLVESLIQDTARPLTTTEDCGGDSATAVPNHTYGYGRIDAGAAVAAVRHSLSLTKTTSVASVTQGDLLTYTLSLTHAHFFKPATSVIVTDVLPAGTGFVTATQPYTLAQGMVTWQRPQLATAENWQLELVVQVTLSPTGSPLYPAPASARLRRPDAGQLDAIVNRYYGARSAETATTGEPVFTRVPAAALPLYLPFVRFTE